MVNTINIDFSVYAETSLGEEVYICGNVKELGIWDMNKALKLVTSKQIYPQWKNQKSLYFQDNITIEFKIFIKNLSGLIRWQKLQENRKFISNHSILINLTYSKYQMVFQQKIIKEQSGTRKNTFQIVHDLSDQMSSSSSGNQRQFWLDKINKHITSHTNQKQFITEAKNLFENWINDKTKIKQRIPNEWTQIITSIHFIIKKNKNYRPNQQVLNYKDDDLIENEQDKKFQLKVHEISINQLDNYMMAFDCPDSTLKLFHIYQQDLNQDVIKKMERLYQGYFIVHINRLNTEDKYLEDVQMIAVKSTSVLKQCLEYFGGKRNYGISMLKENQFLIKKSNKQSIFLYFSPELPFLNDEFSINNQYLSSIEKNLLHQKNFPLFDNLKMSIMIERDILKKVQKQKFTLLILCQKISQIPSKILNCLIRVSSCENVSIFIMTNDEIGEISKKLPCSKEDKILVCNMDGFVFRPEKKPINMYEQLKIGMKKYDDILKQFSNKSNFWVQNGEIQIIPNSYIYRFYLKNDILGEEISQHLLSQFHKTNIKIKYLYEIEKLINTNKKQIIIDIRPIIISVQFFCKVVAALNTSTLHKNYVFSFDYTQGIFKLIDKMDKNCCDKRVIHEGFVIGSTNHRKGLKQDKFQQFLNLLLTFSYSSMTEHEQKQNRSISKKKKDNKDKNSLKIDSMN